MLRGRRVVGFFREDAHPSSGWWRFEDIAFFVRAQGDGLKPQPLLDWPTLHHSTVAVGGNLVDDYCRSRLEAA